MKKNLSLLLLLIIAASVMEVFGQAYLTRNGKITFFSQAPLENIEAINNDVTSILDIKKGEFAFVVLVKSFNFKKALMQEHFNENYMESTTFPKAFLKGNITDLSKVNFAGDGSYPVIVKGDLTIHGITKNIESPGTITIARGKITAVSKFKIRVQDYHIKIPSLVVNKIAETVEVSVDCKYEEFKKS